MPLKRQQNKQPVEVLGRTRTSHLNNAWGIGERELLTHLRVCLRGTDSSNKAGRCHFPLLLLVATSAKICPLTCLRGCPWALELRFHGSTPLDWPASVLVLQGPSGRGLRATDLANPTPSAPVHIVGLPLTNALGQIPSEQHHPPGGVQTARQGSDDPKVSPAPGRGGKTTRISLTVALAASWEQASGLTGRPCPPVKASQGAAQ